MTVTAPQLAARFGWTDQYRALQADADQRRAPQRLLTRAIQGYTEGVVSMQTIATLRGITPNVAATELREAGISPAQHTVTWAIRAGTRCARSVNACSALTTVCRTSTKLGF